MSHFQRFKAFINKDNYNDMEGDVNPYEFHIIFYSFAKLFRVIDDEPQRLWTLPVVLFFLSCAMSAVFICFLCIVYYLDTFDIPLVTEAGAYFILMNYKTMIIICSFTQRANYKNLLIALRGDFKAISTIENKYRKRFFENHLWTWKASVLACTVVIMTGVGMTLVTHLQLVYSLVYDKGGIRPLPFPFWVFGVDFAKSPAYEIAYIYCCMCIISHTITYTFMMSTQILWIRQIMSKADLVIWHIEDLLVDVEPTSDKKQKKFYEKVIVARMRIIIEMHNSMYDLLKEYAGVYTKMLMFEQKVCTPITCLTAYCATVKLEAGEFPGNLIILCIASILVMFIPSYMCNSLSEKVESIGNACYETVFWNAPGRAIRPYFLLLMQRSLRPLPLQAPGFDKVSLATFADKMKFAYSGFNMLRQSSFE